STSRSCTASTPGTRTAVSRSNSPHCLPGRAGSSPADPLKDGRLMLTIRAAWLALVFAASAPGATAAPAPFAKRARHEPSAEVLLERMRAEGFDIRGLKHGPNLNEWLVTVPVWTTVGWHLTTAERVMQVRFAPGNQTARLRAFLHENRLPPRPE